MTSTPLASLLSLQGQTALVTGAAKGIGRAIAERLAEAGATVCVSDIDETEGSAVAKAIGGRFLRADTASVADVRRVVDALVEATGRIDILVNNAGIFPMRPIADVDEALWDRVLDVNLKGAFFFAQAAAQHMVKAGRGGSIVNIASIDALHPTGALTTYDASKGGMVMLTRSLAVELGKHKIRVNAICPGGIQTPGVEAMTAVAMKGMTVTPEQMTAAFTQRIPLGRMGEPDDIARAALFLASPMAAYLTGDVMVVDGGYLLS